MERQGVTATQGEVKIETQPSPKHNTSTGIEIAVKVTSSIVMVLLIAGLALDKLNTGTLKYTDENGIYREVDGECAWKESGSDKNGWNSYTDQCKFFGVDSPGCTFETVGEVWLAFGILGIVAQAAALLSMLVVSLSSELSDTKIRAETGLRLSAMASACVFVLIQWTVWQAKGCGDHEEHTDRGSIEWDLGPSMILVVVAWTLSIIATALQSVSTVSILRGSSNDVSSQGVDLENGANIRS